MRVGSLGLTVRTKSLCDSRSPRKTGMPKLPTPKPVKPSPLSERGQALRASEGGGFRNVRQRAERASPKGTLVCEPAEGGRATLRAGGWLGLGLWLDVRFWGKSVLSFS